MVELFCFHGKTGVQCMVIICIAASVFLTGVLVFAKLTQQGSDRWVTEKGVGYATFGYKERINTTKNCGNSSAEHFQSNGTETEPGYVRKNFTMEYPTYNRKLVKSQGSDFNSGDIIFIAVVIAGCVLSIIVTVTCHIVCRRRKLKAKGRTIEPKVQLSRRLWKVPPNLRESDCAICLEEKIPAKQEVSALSCQHTYHDDCIKKHLRHDFKTPRCPKCRQHAKTMSRWQYWKSKLSNSNFAKDPEKGMAEPSDSRNIKTESKPPIAGQELTAEVENNTVVTRLVAVSVENSDETPSTVLLQTRL